MYKQGDIVLIPVPFSDLSLSKQRPVLVISNNNYNDKVEDILVVAITSNLVQKDYGIMFNNDDLEEGQLKQESMIRIDKMYSLANNIVSKKFGRVEENILMKVRNNINNFIT
ncbi:MAG TPA: MazF family transcriptional regulator [Clostridiales bacterium]|nr:MAG: MazF family transcriptional regulator [Clostridiales bacterium GWD2_32_59]HAN10573.1 MazF family transcriptional regulator [Clostridiales bacterium]